MSTPIPSMPGLEDLADRGVLYTLAADGRTAQPARGAAWAAWYMTAERRVRLTRVGDAVLSTVFLGIDLHFGLGRLELWETTVFKLTGVEVAGRYATYDDAVRGHGQCVHAQVLATGAAPEELYDDTHR
jgi:hypothetical protein